MNAVRAFIEDANGSISIQLKGRKENGFSDFSFVIELPLDLFNLAPPLQSVS